jgi:hypothetical protein
MPLKPLGHSLQAWLEPPYGAVGAIAEVVGIGGVAVEQLKAVLLLQFLQDGLFDVVFGDEVGHGKNAILAARWNLLYLFCPVLWSFANQGNLAYNIP